MDGNNTLKGQELVLDDDSKEENGDDDGETDRGSDPLAEDTNNESPSDEDICNNMDQVKSASPAMRAPNRRSCAPAVSKRRRPPLANARGAPPNRRARKRRRRDYDIDSDDSRSSFLDIERRKLESAERLNETLLGIRGEMKRMVHTLGEIRDCVLAAVITQD